MYYDEKKNKIKKLKIIFLFMNESKAIYFIYWYFHRHPNFLYNITQNWWSTTHEECLFKILWKSVFYFIFINKSYKPIPILSD